MSRDISLENPVPKKSSPYLFPNTDRLLMNTHSSPPPVTWNLSGEPCDTLEKPFPRSKTIRRPSSSVIVETIFSRHSMKSWIPIFVKSHLPMDSAGSFTPPPNRLLTPSSTISSPGMQREKTCLILKGNGLFRKNNPTDGPPSSSQPLSSSSLSSSCFHVHKRTPAFSCPTGKGLFNNSPDRQRFHWEP